VIHACAKSNNGQLRLDTGSGCLPSEQAVQWNQTGPPGPSGNTDSTVRHMSNFMADGKTVSTPISSGLGRLGNLSLSCGSDPSGGFGTIGYTSTNSSGFQERLIFWSLEPYHARQRPVPLDDRGPCGSRSQRLTAPIADHRPGLRPGVSAGRLRLLRARRHL
jgi:hypothetical protein